MIMVLNNKTAETLKVYNFKNIIFPKITLRSRVWRLKCMFFDQISTGKKKMRSITYLIRRKIDIFAFGA